MKIKLLVLTLGLVINACAVQITGFGTGDLTITNSGFLSTSQTISALSLSGSDDKNIFGSFSSKTVGSVSSLYLTATRSSASAVNVQIELFDSFGESVIYAANLSSFVLNTVTEVQFNYLSGSSSFNGSAVSLGFYTTGVGSGTVSISLDNLSTTASAIPEPSVYAALFGVSVLGIVIARRRHLMTGK